MLMDGGRCRGENQCALKKRVVVSKAVNSDMYLLHRHDKVDSAEREPIIALLESDTLPRFSHRSSLLHILVLCILEIFNE